MLIHILNLLGLLSFLGEHIERLVVEDFPSNAAYFNVLFSVEILMPASLFYSLGETKIDVAWQPNFTIGLSHDVQFRFCDLDTELEAKVVLMAQLQRILVNRVGIAAENMR